MKTMANLFAGLTFLLGVGPAIADCGGATIKEVTRAYADGQRLEKKGDHRAALGAYAAAQAAQRTIQESAFARKSPATKNAKDDLASELGMRRRSF